MRIKLEKTKSGEIKDIAPFYAKEYRKPPYNENWTIKKAIDRLKFFKKFNDLYSIKLRRELVGFVTVNPNFMCPGEIAYGEELVIKEQFQGKGIGTIVIKKILKIYKKRGFKRFLGISDIKSKAFKLYKKLGILPSRRDILIEKKLNN